VSRYDDVYAVVRDGRLGHAPAGSSAGEAEADAHKPIALLDGAAHERVRSLLRIAFPPRTADSLRPRLEETAVRLVSELARIPDPVDLVSQYALPFAFAPVAELAAIPAEDVPSVVAWGSALAAAGDPPSLLTQEVRATAARARGEFASYVAGMVVRRRRRGGDDVVSRLAAAEANGERLDFAELVTNGAFFIVNGYHNTVNLIANAMLALLQHRRQLELVAAEPSRSALAVEEAARYDSPIHAIGRYAHTDYDLGGATVRAGEAIAALVGAAHRDPDAFDDPDRFDVTRGSSRPLLTFGGGEHACIGAKLAHLAAEVALRTLLERFPALEPAGAPVRAPTFTLRGLSALPVRLRPAGRSH
jgi:cytochrome P450